MKKVSIILAAAILGAFSIANAQLTVSMSESNGQMSIRVNSVISGMTPGNKVVRNIRVYDNVAHTATVAGLRDTFIATSTTAIFTDSLHTSVPFPWLYYVTDTVQELDSSGSIVATDFAVNDTGVRLTPYFINPTQIEKNQRDDTANAYFDGTFMSGYDDAVVTVIVSIGDQTFSRPNRTHPAVTEIIEPVIGTTMQNVLKSVVVPIGANNFPYSYRVYIKNSKKTDSSVIFKGRTHGGITSEVSEPVSGGQVLIYPNPVQNQFTIQCEGNWNLIVSDVLGNIVMQSPGSGTKTFDRGQIVPGHYFFRIIRGGTYGGHIVQQIVVFN